ncbi:thiol-disulfide oxidoreductase DCC family protein [Halopseudomonas sp.]|uniref:thiol-disulfide oxidoreductase DCC family protein n=1 Tax=Halopseudomonas sp. TaxID=2901191 RepID=UPI003563E15B
MHTTTPDWPLTLFYDGECPLCLREIRMFQRRNDRGRLELIDIANSAADPLPGLSRQDMLDCLHAHFRDGQLVTGIDATYWSYRAVGLGWVVAPLGWHWARPLWKWGYRQFCRLRPAIARIVPMPGSDAGVSCESDRCRPPKPND